MAAVTAFVVGMCAAAALVGMVAAVAGVRLPRRSPGTFAKVPPGRVVVALSCGAVALASTGIAVTLLLGVALGWWVPGLVADVRARHFRLSRKDAITAWTRQVADVMIGTEPVTAIRATVDTAPRLIAGEVRQFNDDLERMAFEDAVQLFAERLGDTDGEMVAAALKVAKASGAAASGVLVELAAMAAANAEMWRRVDAARAGLDVRARFITGFFVAGFVLARIVAPGLLTPFRSALGQLVLAATAALFAVSYLWLGRMRRAVLPDTILARSEVPA
ncbi:MAG: type II secretion system F family protein [Acidimicrobiales bacterium]